MSETAFVIFMIWAAFVFFGLTRTARGTSSIGNFSMRAADRDTLTTHLPYYAHLSERDQRTFEKRLTDLINDKEFHGRGMEVTREMKVMIAGAAVQLTFGLDPLLLMHFTHIVVYPDRYRNPFSKKEHIGEVNPGMRVIAVSWRHFREGFEVPTNARNVGLHEMAHALWLENRIPNSESDFFDADVLALWRRLAEEEAVRINAGQSSLFREYAARDQAEFFAVAVEYFFEQPELYQDRLPSLYECMVQLLRQDPLLIGRPTPPDA